MESKPDTASIDLSADPKVPHISPGAASVVSQSAPRLPLEILILVGRHLHSSSPSSLIDFLCTSSDLHDALSPILYSELVVNPHSIHSLWGRVADVVREDTFRQVFQYDGSLDIPPQYYETGPSPYSKQPHQETSRRSFRAVDQADTHGSPGDTDSDKRSLGWTSSLLRLSGQLSHVESMRIERLPQMWSINPASIAEGWSTLISRSRSAKKRECLGQDGEIASLCVDGDRMPADQLSDTFNSSESFLIAPLLFPNLDRLIVTPRAIWDLGKTGASSRVVDLFKAIHHSSNLQYTCLSLPVPPSHASGIQPGQEMYNTWLEITGWQGRFGQICRTWIKGKTLWIHKAGREAIPFAPGLDVFVEFVAHPGWKRNNGQYIIDEHTPWIAFQDLVNDLPMPEESSQSQGHGSNQDDADSSQRIPTPPPAPHTHLLSYETSAPHAIRPRSSSEPAQSKVPLRATQISWSVVHAVRKAHSPGLPKSWTFIDPLCHRLSPRANGSRGNKLDQDGSADLAELETEVTTRVKRGYSRFVSRGEAMHTSVEQLLDKVKFVSSSDTASLERCQCCGEPS